MTLTNVKLITSQGRRSTLSEFSVVPYISQSQFPGKDFLIPESSSTSTRSTTELLAATAAVAAQIGPEGR